MTPWLAVAIGFSIAGVIVYIKTGKLSQSLAVHLTGGIIVAALIVANILRANLNS